MSAVSARIVGVLVASALVVGAPGTARGQTVEGTVVGASGRVFVRLLDQTGREVTAQVSDPAGRFLFAAPADGRYRVRAERPGFRDEEGPVVRVSAGARTVAEVAVPERPLSLGSAPLPSGDRCGPVTGGRDRLTLAWHSVRTAAAMAAWNGRRGELRLDARIHHRQLEADGTTVLRAERPVERTGVTRLEASVEAADLFQRGFIREDADGSMRYFSPTPDVLTNPDFPRRYCLRIQDAPGPLLGIAFEPRRKEASDEVRPDVAGVIWLDRDGGVPIRLEFAYRNVDPAVVPPSAGGTTTFTLLPDGSWVTAEVTLRMPLLQVVDTREGQVWEVTGLREERARLVRVQGPDGTWTLTPRSGVVEGRVTGDAGAPLEDALVELVGTGVGVRTDADGRFRFDGLLEGTYRVAADHPRFDALPMGPGVPAVVVVPGDTARLVLSPPSAEDAALQLCPPDVGAGSVILTGQVVDSLSGEVLVGAPLSVRFLDPRRDGTPYHEARVSSGTGGYYVYCDAPRGQTVRIRPALPGARVEDDVTFVALSPVERQDVVVRLSTEQAQGGVFGLIRDARTGQGIEAADIRVQDTDYRAMTNSNGFFAIPDVRPGLYAVTVGHLAYQDREVVVRIDGGQAYQVDVDLEVDAIPLEGITVSVVPSRLFGDMVDLQRRMEMGFGDFLVRRDLESRGGTLASALQGRLGVRVVTGGNRPGERYVVLRQARDITSIPASEQNGETLDAGPSELVQEYCFPAVWVDGHRLSMPRSGGIGHDPVDFSQFLTLDIEAVEVYRGAASVPGEFGGGDAACGAVVIWTRRGGRTVRGDMGPGTGTEWR